MPAVLPVSFVRKRFLESPVLQASSIHQKVTSPRSTQTFPQKSSNLPQMCSHKDRLRHYCYVLCGTQRTGTGCYKRIRQRFPRKTERQSPAVSSHSRSGWRLYRARSFTFTSVLKFGGINEDEDSVTGFV